MTETVTVSSYNDTFDEWEDTRKAEVSDLVEALQAEGYELTLRDDGSIHCDRCLHYEAGEDVDVETIYPPVRRRLPPLGEDA